MSLKDLASNLVPKKYQRDPRLQGYYFLLPPQLLQLVQRDTKVLEKLNRDSFQLDIELTASTHGMQHAVGFRDCVPIQYHLLAPETEISVLPQIAQEWGVTEDNLERMLRFGETRVQTQNVMARAYNGWLLTNGDFLAQYRILQAEGQRWIETEGFPTPWVNPIARSDFSEPVADTAKESWIKQMLFFYKSWQLASMAAPYLPLPLQVLEMTVAPALNSNEFRQLSATMSIPAITAVSAQELRSTVEYLSGRRQSDEHLRGWMQIVEDANQQRAVQIKGYERRFRLAHFWRVFQDHYGEQLEQARVKQRLVNIFAEFLGVENQVILRSLAVFKANRLMLP